MLPSHRQRKPALHTNRPDYIKQATGAHTDTTTTTQTSTKSVQTYAIPQQKQKKAPKNESQGQKTAFSYKARLSLPARPRRTVWPATGRLRSGHTYNGASGASSATYAEALVAEANLKLLKYEKAIMRRTWDSARKTHLGQKTLGMVPFQVPAHPRDK